MIPLVDLTAQYQSIKDEVLSAATRVLESGRFVLGPEVESFEREFAEYCGASHGVAVNTGTSALHLALLAAGVGPGDEVVTVSFTFAATVSAICYTGAKPVFVDIHPASYTMDVSQLEGAISQRTKAIIPVHLYGQSADLGPITEIAQRHDLVVIEDACQAHGAEYQGRRVGGLGDLGCFSFYPAKNLGACGEAGMVVTSDAEHAEKMRTLRNWGQDEKNHHVAPGYNYHMDEIQAAILRVKLRFLESWLAARRACAARYTELLADLPIQPPVEMPYGRHVYHLYAVRVAERDALKERLGACGIQTGVHYPVPVHLQDAYTGLGYGPGDFPESERLAAEELSLPMYPELTGAQQEEVVAALRHAHES